MVDCCCLRVLNRLCNCLRHIHIVWTTAPTGCLTVWSNACRRLSSKSVNASFITCLVRCCLKTILLRIIIFYVKRKKCSNTLISLFGTLYIYLFIFAICIQRTNLNMQKFNMHVAYKNYVLNLL